MNIPCDWAELLNNSGWHTETVRSIEPQPQTDADVVQLARDRGAVLFTHDMEWGAILPLTTDKGPSVFQIFSKELVLEKIGPTVIRVLREVEPLLEKGALLLVDMETGRTRVQRLFEDIE